MYFMLFLNNTKFGIVFLFNLFRLNISKAFVSQVSNTEKKEHALKSNNSLKNKSRPNLSHYENKLLILFYIII